jgi:hypothetical protein
MIHHLPINAYGLISNWIDEQPLLHNLPTSRKKDFLIFIWRVFEYIYYKNDVSKDIKFSNQQNKAIPLSFQKYPRMRIIGSNKLFTYKEALTCLEAGDLVWIRKHYQPGQYPMSYRCLLANLDTSFHLIVDDKPQVNKTQDYLKLYPEFKTQILTTEKSTLDLKRLYDDLPLQGFEYEKVFRIHTLTNRFINGERTFSTGSSDYPTTRFYTSFSRLPKYSRSYLKIDGMETSSFDLSCCHPLFLSYQIDNPVFRKDCESGMFWKKIHHNTELSKKHFFSQVLFCDKIRETSFVKHLTTIYPHLISQISEYRGSIDKPLWFILNDIERKVFMDPFERSELYYLSCHDEIYYPKHKRKLYKSILEDALITNGIKNFLLKEGK